MTGQDAPPAAVSIRALDAAEAGARLGELADILVDAVAHGASVNFLAGFARDEGLDFWRGQLPGMAGGAARLLVGEDGGRLVGTVLLFFARQPNAPHRAEVGKMLVLSSHRRRGLGRGLLAAAEAAAGVGWSVRSPLGVVSADSVQVLSADTLQVHFNGAVPAQGTLYYGYGYGRLAGSDEPGQGNAIYDDAGLPLWTPAAGIAVAMAPPAADALLA